MAKHTLILDTNVIVASKYRLNGATWRLLFALVRMGEVRLIVPEVVIREAVGRYRSGLREARRDMDRLGIGLDLLDDWQAYEAELRAQLSPAETPNEPSCSLLDLADKAIYRRPPFNQGGNGFRDAMVWAHAVDAVEAYGAVVLLTGDSDFLEGGNPAKLKKALAKESKGLVSPFRTVDEWISTIKIGDSPPVVHAAAAEKMVSTNDDLASTIATALELRPVSVRNRSHLDAEVTGVAVKSPIALLSLKVSEEANDQHLAVFRVTVEFTLETPGDDGEPTGWTTGRVDVTGTMSYDPKNDEFGDPEFEVVEVPPPPRRIGSIGPLVNVADMDAVIRVMSEVSRVSQKQWASSGITSVFDSMFDVSELVDDQWLGTKAALVSQLDILDTWSAQQSAMVNNVVESIRKSYVAALLPIAELGEQLLESYGAVPSESKDEVSEPDSEGASDEPKES